jgi:lipopolysaccharide transport system permease protein
VTSATPDSLAGELRTPFRAAPATAEATAEAPAAVAIPAETGAPVEVASQPVRAPLPPVEVVDYRPSLWQTLKESWRVRHLLWDLAITALLAYFVKYRLGPTWLVLNTLMGVIGWSLIGGGILNVAAPNGMPYFLYTMVGLMGWNLFQSTLTISCRSFLRLKALIRDVYFPLILVPIAGSSQAYMRFFLLFTTYVGCVFYYWLAQGHLYAQLAPKYLFFSFAGLFLCVALAWGIGLWTAPLTAHTRDVRMLIRYVTPFLFFVTPVIYPIEQLHGKTRLIAEINPLSSPVEMAKIGLTGAGSVRTFAALWSVCGIALVFASGVWFMNRFGLRVVGLAQQSEVLDDDDEMLL